MYEKFNADCEAMITHFIVTSEGLLAIQYNFARLLLAFYFRPNGFH